ncbi:OBG-type G domain-containing protein [Haematococcus lacustris]|uniref:OBG-type G domain-containing protein n=1 Tax=Haematococcus lacustris TaxID=44745 RepID=A0A699ZMN6_HAELA|nr:OBG-type G domain-containing protein [Haematococcus lacustris]
MVLDATKPWTHRDILTRELESVGMRLNKSPPNVYFRKRKTGGLSINSTIQLTQLDDKMIARILQEYRIHNCELLFKEDIGVDDLIDLIEGNRRYIKCLYVYNKVDMASIEEVDEIAHRPNSVPISCSMNLNMDGLLCAIWDAMALVRCYTKKVGAKPDFGDPVVMTQDRGGTTVEALCGLTHKLEDEDVVQIVKKKVKTGEDGRGRFKNVGAGAKPDRIADREKKAALKS